MNIQYINEQLVDAAYNGDLKGVRAALASAADVHAGGDDAQRAKDF